MNIVKIKSNFFIRVAYNFLTPQEDGEVWPGIWTPLNHLNKASAVKVLFPNIINALGFEDDKLPPPRVRD